MMRRFGQSVALMLMAWGWATTYAGVPKLIYSAWDIHVATPENILSNAAKFASQGFDGIFMGLYRIPMPDGTTGSVNTISVDAPWPRESLLPYLPVVQEIVKRPGLTESGLVCIFQPSRRKAWTNAAEWVDFAANMRTWAWFAKSAGLKHLMLDTEDYRSVRQFIWQKGDPPYDEAARLARQRGRELFRGLFEEYPDAHVIGMWLFSMTRDYRRSQDIAADVHGHGDLWVPFLNGVLDVMPDTARISDGNEFMYKANNDTCDYEKNFVAQHRTFLDLVVPENRDRYRRCFRSSCGFYLDMYVNSCLDGDGRRRWWYKGPSGGNRLNTFIDDLQSACDTAEEVVWIFGERRAVVQWEGVDVLSGWEDAFTNGTWECAMPGMAEQMRIVHNPRTELMPRLKALLDSGAAMNLAGTFTVKKGEASVNVSGTKYGEWYAVVVEVEGEDPYVEIQFTHKGETFWGLPVEHPVLSPLEESDLRRGVAFARIRGPADGLRVISGSNRKNRQVRTLRLEVYRVYAPSSFLNKKQTITNKGK